MPEQKITALTQWQMMSLEIALEYMLGNREALVEMIKREHTKDLVELLNMIRQANQMKTWSNKE